VRSGKHKLPGMLVCLLVAAELLLLPLHAETTVSGSRSSASIINGTPAPGGTYPWMAALLRKSSSAGQTPSRLKFCAGSLIAPEWVLTAAHCAEAVSANAMQVLLGRDNLDGSGGELHAVSEIIINPYYFGDNNYSDIALLRLATKSAITPVSLPAAADVGTLATLPATALGWGSTSGQNKLACTLQLGTPTPANAGDYSCKTYVYRTLTQTSSLRSGQLSVLSNAACNARFRGFLTQHHFRIPADLTDNKVLYPRTLCVADVANLVSTCYGDSGGPLLVEKQGRVLLAGITSFGLELSCQGTNQLAFFTEVASFLDFIAEGKLGQQALRFDKLCPAAVTLQVSYQTAVAGISKVRVYWDKVELATGYSLLFVPLPRLAAAVRTQSLPATAAELTVELQSGQRYLIAVQARGKECDSKVSKSLEVVVP
jgi:secreted trypsin-like serine protease